MISFLLTLFICLFSICPSYDSVEDQYENNTIPVKNVFVNDENDDGSVYSYVYTITDLSSQNAFLDIRNYFLQYGNYSVDDDDMPVNAVYVLPIRKFYISNFSNFDYAAGYPYNLHTSWEVNYLAIRKNSVSSNTIYYSLGLLQYSDSSIDSSFELLFRKAKNFDYVIGCRAYYNDTPYDNMDYACFGITDDGSQFYPSLYDILPTLGDRTHNRADYETGWNQGYQEGESTGYQNGYNDGLSAGDYDTTASTIFTGILNVALIPVNVFLTIFNFEVFGINISGIVAGLLTLSVVIIIFRFLFGGGKDD